MNWKKYAVAIVFSVLANQAVSSEVTTDTKASEEFALSAKEIARREAEIAKSIEEYNKYPKAYITPRTKDPDQAAYYQQVAKIIEKRGMEHWPIQNGERLYGKGVVTIYVTESGIIKKDGVSIDRSTGDLILDQKMLEIVRNSSPLPALPLKPSGESKEETWVLIFPFNFTKPLEQ